MLSNSLIKRIRDFNFPGWLRQNLLPVSLLIVLVFASYLNSLNNDFVADDVPGILQNLQLANFASVFSNPLGFLRPLFYFFSYQIGGLNPWPYHLFSLFFHLGTVLAAYLLITLLADSLTALFAASFLAVHPILIEAVSWISGAVHSQYGFFLILSLLFYVLSLRRPRFYLLSLASFFLSLLSSEKAVVLPLVLLAFVLAFGEVRKSWKKLLPFFFISLLWAFLYLGGVSQRITVLETQYYHQARILNPLVQIPVAISSYLELISWPQDLTLYHSEMNFSQEQYLLRLAVFLVFLGIVFWSWFKNRPVFFWLSFFLISLLPTLTPLGISWIVAERYVYLGSLGIFAVVALILAKLATNPRLKPFVFSLFTVLVISLSLRTITRNMDWQNQDSLWLSAVKTSPSSPQNHNNLGDYYGRHGDLERALAEFQKAIELQPNYGDAYHNLANTYNQLGKTDLAIENYQKALEFNPGLWQSYLNLGLIYQRLGQIEKAEAEFRKALEINPKLIELFQSPSPKPSN